MNPDHALTTSYHTLADGFNFTLCGSRPAGTDEKWTVCSMSVSDSATLRSVKGETNYQISRIVFRDGRSYPEGLPATSIYQNLDRSEVMRRMKFYGWRPKAHDPSVEAPRCTDLSEPRRVSAAGSWELHELDGAKLYLKFRSQDDAEMLDEIRRANGLLYEVFDQHTLTLYRYRTIIAAALPKGWSTLPHYRGNDLSIRICNQDPPNGGYGARELSVGVYRPITAGEFSKRLASLPDLNARRVKLEKAVAEFTKDGKITVRDPKDRAVLMEMYDVCSRIGDVPDFLTSKAAIWMPRLSDADAKEFHEAVESVRKVLRNVDRLDPDQAHPR